MRQTSMLLITLIFGVISNANAQTEQKVKNKQTIQKADKKMETDFNQEQKKSN